MASSKKILILYTDSGGGHHSTAQALKTILERKTAHSVLLSNPSKDVISEVDLFLRLTGLSGEEVYNRFVLKKGCTNLFCLMFYGLI